MGKTETFEISADQYLAKLIKIKKERSNINGYIAEQLLHKLKMKQRIERGVEFCEEIGVSPSALSIFVKVFEVNNAKEIFFLHNSSINAKYEIENNEDQKIVQAAELINKAHRNFFIGVSGALGNNMDFQIKLLRMNKTAIIVWNKYEQIGISRLLNKDDVIIVNSVSLQHSWMIDLIKYTEAKIILLSSWMPDEIKDKVTIFFQILSKEQNDGMRLYAMEGRMFVSEIYYRIFKVMQQDPKNFKNLQITSFN
ncbi:hypothetical protein [Mycoplasmopsis gallinacea]|uniref:MurR/RpiR family transcriptional regulator n=1 Tax=Mycoplasmopsis gallinacea TaxID=29556 RepID=A0A0D5ZJT3_9BACT|nr:hypothetical protein [Mycoplasmopsis gallinacea]AKA50031.1 hypothetical protein VO56_02085 [Mycoplasmopsis gallinacea]QIW62109.1 hypothetical protein GOQ20_01400 [Mycoplasmopsis gallinacea]